MEKLFIVLLTTLSSNILDDNEALTLISRCLKNITHIPDAKNVRKHSVKIMHLLDECVGSGYRELATPDEIETRLTMFSAEEEAKERQRKETEKKQKEFVQRQSEEALQRRLVYLSSGGDVKKEFEIDGGISSESRKAVKSSSPTPSLVPPVSSTGGISKETRKERENVPVPEPEVKVSEDKPSKPRLTLKAKRSESLL
ncbi:hypothetical protein GEMRC1_013870 [Eukaryota sp. GEM-RC1]